MMSMDVPNRIVQAICDHVFQVVSQSGSDLDLSSLSRACGQLALNVLRYLPIEQIPNTLDVDVLEAWAERFGKHVGIFFLAEKEG